MDRLRLHSRARNPSISRLAGHFQATASCWPSLSPLQTAVALRLLETLGQIHSFRSSDMSQWWIERSLAEHRRRGLSGQPSLFLLQHTFLDPLDLSQTNQE